MTYRPEGDPSRAKIVFVGEAPSHEELFRGRPFVGPAGSIFDSCLQSAQIIRSECYITNVFDVMVYKPMKQPGLFLDKNTKEPLFQEKRGFTEQGEAHRKRLLAELDQCGQVHVVVPLGSAALLALTGKRSITKWRGSILSGYQEVKTIPTIHPAAVLRGQFLWQYLIRWDLERVSREAAFPEITPLPYRFTLRPTLNEIVQVLRWLRHEQITTAVDVEVKYGYISLCSLAWTPYDALVIDFLDGWDIRQEIEIWRELALYLEDESITKIMHNGMFDMWMFHFKHRILPRGRIKDTMVRHHLMYPDFKKGLDLLGSLYTDQPFWKDMVKHSEIDKADG